MTNSNSSDRLERIERTLHHFVRNCMVEGRDYGVIPGTNSKPTLHKSGAEIFDQINTIQKMAQKRSLVGAVLIATGATEFFTQDLEDL